MAEQLTTTKLEPDSHLLLDQPLLRLPHELLRKNLKTAQRQIEMVNKNITSTLSTTAKDATPEATLASLDATLLKAQTLKRKLEALHQEEKSLHKQQKARISHLQSLHEIPSLADVKYDHWSHIRLNRLLIDYLLRQGYTASARALATEQNLSDLVDVPVFEECGRIEKSLREGKVTECLAWCSENKQALKKMGSQLEMELRLQQFIELARGGEMEKLIDAIVHARRHLAGGQDVEFGLKAGGLLAYREGTRVEPYQTMYSPKRYLELAESFRRTHHELFSIPLQPLLHIALSAGLSALKTPTCHSVHNTLHTIHNHQQQPSSSSSEPSAAVLIGTPVCPICSTELNELARNVPYAHHTKSFMEDDPVVLPNGRVFGRERLKMLNEKLGVSDGKVRDPTDAVGTEWEEREMRKVYIS